VADVSGLNPSSCGPWSKRKQSITLSLPWNQFLRFRFCSSIVSRYLTLMPTAQFVFEWGQEGQRFFFWLFLWRRLWAAPSESDIAEGQCGPQLCRRRGRCCFRPECRFRHPAPRKRDCGTPVSHLGLTHIGDQRQKAGWSMKLNKRFPPMNRRTESFLDGKAWP
jgi:hypothetical protein